MIVIQFVLAVEQLTTPSFVFETVIFAIFFLTVSAFVLVVLCVIEAALFVSRSSELAVIEIVQ